MKSVLAAFLVAIGAAPAGAQTVLTVQQFHQNSKAYVKSTVQLTGLAYSVRQKTRRAHGVDVPYLMLNLYETDAKGRKGKYYVYVSLPASAFKNAVNEGDVVTVTGPIEWPYQVGRIGD